MRPRRLVALVCGVLLAVCLLAACGDDEPSAHQTSSVDSKFGTVDVPAAPTRVVALGWGDAEIALALGVQPVGAADWMRFGPGQEGVGPWAQGLYDSPPVLLPSTTIDVRAITALHPDLILDTRDSGDRSRYAELSAIAPTVSVPQGAENFQTTTEQQVQVVAQALGRADAGTKLLADLDAAFASAAAAHATFAQHTATAAAYSHDGWAVYTGADPRVTFLTRLGFQQTPAVQALPTRPTYVPVTGVAPRLADVLVSFPIFLPPSSVTDQPGYQALAQVRQQHAVVVGSPVERAFDMATPASLTYALGILVPLLAKAVPAA